MAKKPSLGRQKIKIAKIQIKNHLQVTFSKRRSGLFKKASELCTLCGVEIAIVVFSPAGKVFSFGHPKVESVIDRFLARNPNLNSTSGLHLVEAHRIASIPDLNMQLTYMLNELEAEKKRSETLDEMRKAGQSQFWWEAPIENLNLHELEQLKDSMEGLKRSVSIQANRLFAENSNAMSFFGTNNSTNGVDHYDIKPVAPMITSTSSSAAASHVHSYGYGHGLF